MFFNVHSPVTGRKPQKPPYDNVGEIGGIRVNSGAPPCRITFVYNLQLCMSRADGDSGARDADKEADRELETSKGPRVN